MNGLQMTLQELNPEICRQLIVTVSDFRVKLSRFLESEGDLKIQEELCSLRSCGLLKSDTLQFFSQKTLEGFLAMRGGAHIRNYHQYNGRPGVRCRMASA